MGLKKGGKRNGIWNEKVREISLNENQMRKKKEERVFLNLLCRNWGARRIKSCTRSCDSAYSAAEAVESSSLSLEGVDDVESGDGLSLGVLGVGDGVPDHIFEENFKNTSGLFVDKTGDALNATSAGQSANGGLGDALDVVAKDLAVALGASLSESLSSFTTS